MQKSFPYLAAIAGIFIIPLAFADAPVVNAYQTIQNTNQNSNLAGTNSNANVQSGLSLPQQVAKLERQVQALNQMNVRSQISQLQQQVQDLRGQLQLANHKIQTLQKQQKSIYQDLDHRLVKLSALKGAKPSATTVLPKTMNQHKPAKISKATGVAIPKQSANFLTQQSVYEAAYHLISNKQYKQAMHAMQMYLKNYPKGQYASNAHYWLGELYLIDKQSSKALKEFQTVVNNYPNSEKVPGAKFKIGFIYFNTGQLSKARQQLRLVENEYPGTTIAKLAEQRLHKIAQL